MAAISSREANILAIIRAMPVDCSDISVSDNKLMDKIVAGIQVSVAETFRHTILLKELSPKYAAVFNKKTLRVITLSDGIAKVYDLTKERIVGIQSYDQGDRLTLNRRPLNWVSGLQYWGTPHDTDYVFVCETGDHIVQIFEQEVGRRNQKPREYICQVDLTTTVPFQHTYICDGEMHEATENVYVIRNSQQDAEGVAQ